MSDNTLPPGYLPPPSPTTVQMLVSTGLTIAKLLAGAGIGGTLVASLTSDKLTIYVTLALYALSGAGAVAAWLGSWWQHYKLAKADRATSVASAVASARTGQPVIVVPAPTLAAPTATATAPVSRSDIVDARVLVDVPNHG